MAFISWTFQFRWLLWGFGFFHILFWRFGYWDQYSNQITKFSERHFQKILIAVVGSFFALSLLAKYSQFWSLALNGQDFWLFVDLLEQAKHGAFFLTRFAPHDLGFVQHGSVHPMFTWAILAPWAWLIGSVHVALLFNPAALSAAGWMVGMLTRSLWGPLYALCFATAFLASTQWGRVLMYDVHPEAAYPFFVLLWFWALGLDGTRRVRWASLCLATLLCVGLKEDSFLVLMPWIFWACIGLRGLQRRGAILSGILAVGVLYIQMVFIKHWVAGTWGPSVWEGSPVVRSAGLGVFKGLHWTGWSDISKIGIQLVQDQGGVAGLFRKLGTFLTSRPWLSLCVLAPWVLKQGQFWLVILPLASVYSILDGPRMFWNYYSAPFLGSFWFCAVSQSGRFKSKSLRVRPFWALGAALVLGSGSLQIFWPTAEVKETKNDVNSLLPCLGNKGIVQSHLLGLVPLNQVWTDRVPRTQLQWNTVDFALFSPSIGRYELSQPEAAQLYNTLSASPEWKQIGKDCRSYKASGQFPGRAQAQRVVLFIRSSKPGRELAPQ